MAPRAKKSDPAGGDGEGTAGGGTGRVHLFFGSDDLSAKKAADACVERLCPEENRDFGLEILEPEGPAPNAEASAALLRNVLGAVLTPPFLGGGKTVYLKRAPFFDPLTEPGRYADVKAVVEKLADLVKKGLPEGVELVIWATKVNKSTAFYKACAKLGEAKGFENAEYARDAKENFYPALDEAIRKEGLKFTAAAKESFVGRTGFSLRQALGELEKLSLYLGERRDVTPEDVQRMVAPSRESKPWDFADAYCSGRVDETLLTMRRLLMQKESPVAMLSILETKLRDMVLFRDAINRGWCEVGGSSEWPRLAWKSPLPDEAEAALSALASDPRKLMPPFRAAKTAAQANRFPAGRWFRWLNAAADAHAAMTGDSALAPELELELFVMKTIGAFKKGGGKG